MATKPPPPPPDRVTAYAQGVLAGKIVAGPHVRDACERHLDDLGMRARAGSRSTCTAMQRALEFFPTCCACLGGEFEGKPFELAPSQAFIVGSLFGWIDDEGRRRFRVAYIEEGKGNGKSPLAAGIGLLMLGADGEARAEVYAAASKKDQAMILFRDAVAMVRALARSAPARAPDRRAPGLEPQHRGCRSFARSAATMRRSGPRPHCGLIDEVHEHRDDNVIEMMRAGFKARRTRCCS